MKPKPGTQLYNANPHGPPKIKASYKDKQSAVQTLKRLKTRPKPYQQQVATTMYYRAKHHKYQTRKMRNAMIVYKKFINTL